MGRLRINPALLTFIIITLFFGISLLFRVLLPYDTIFSGDSVKFARNDIYFYMRLVDNLSHNFPDLTQFDPYLIYPNGGLTYIPFFHWFIAAFAWLIGLGSPSQHLVDVVGAFAPAILGALTVVPVYFLGKALFGRWAGILAAGLIAIIPGEFMSRTVLGNTDHDPAEVFFTTTAALFLVLAIKISVQKQVTLTNFLKPDWKAIRLPLLFSLLAGLFLGMYLATWLGGLLFVFIISCFYVIQFINNHLRHRSSDHLGIIGFISFLVAFIIFIPNSLYTDLRVGMLAAVFVPLVLWGISRLISGRGLKAFYYPLSLAGLGIIVFFIVRAISPGIVTALVDKFMFVFSPSGSTAVTTQEMTPFLMPFGDFTATNAWGNFATSFFLVRGWPIPGFALISFSVLLYLFVSRKDRLSSWQISLTWVLVNLAMLLMLVILVTFQDYRFFAIIPLLVFIYLFFKQQKDDEYTLLFFVWTLVILVATLVQRRFAYYLAVNVSLLSAYLAWQAIWLAGARKLVTGTGSVKESYFTEAQKKANLYEVLGVARGASIKAIKKAHRRLTAEFHPDRNPTPEQTKKFKEITDAYEVLSNPDKRKAHDSPRGGAPEKDRAKKTPEHRGNTYAQVTYTIIAVIAVFFTVYFFNITHARTIANDVPFAPSDAWQSSLTWMRNNTPDPMGDPEAYYRLYDAPPTGETFRYPASAYGVTAWWDYGYWITHIAHRIPSANPSQDPGPIRKVASLMLSQNETFARDVMEDLGSSYIIIDNETSTSKFWAIADWSGSPENKYLGLYYVPYQGNIVPLTLFELEYYQTLCARLYNFDGKAVTGKNAVVVTYEDRVNQDGGSYRLVTAISEEFATYEEAVKFMSANQTGKQRIIGANPFISPISLEPVEDYTLIYSSEIGVTYQNVGSVPEVKIFQYTPRK